MVKAEDTKGERPESQDGLLRLIAWYYSSKEIAIEELKEFITRIIIEDPDPEYVQEIYRRYCDSIHKTGFALAKKMQGN